MKDKRKEIKIEKPIREVKEDEALINPLPSDIKPVEDDAQQLIKPTINNEDTHEIKPEYRVEVTIPKIQVREAPNSTAESVDVVSKGQTITIVGEKDGWGKTKYGKGWVNLKYTRRV